MKYNFKVSLLTLAVLFTLGCQYEEENVSIQSIEKASEENIDKKSVYIPQTRIQQQAYALGATFATQLSIGVEQPVELGIELDKAYVLQGINDAFLGSPVITPAAASELLEALQEDVATAAAQKEKNESLAVEAAG